jgi:hypothetical protein
MYANPTFQELKRNQLVSDLFGDTEISNLSDNRQKPKLNSYMRVQEQSQEGLQNWLNYIKNL